MRLILAAWIVGLRRISNSCQFGNHSLYLRLNLQGRLVQLRSFMVVHRRPSLPCWPGFCFRSCQKLSIFGRPASSRGFFSLDNHRKQCKQNEVKNAKVAPTAIVINVQLSSSYAEPQRYGRSSPSQPSPTWVDMGLCALNFRDKDQRRAKPDSVVVFSRYATICESHRGYRTATEGSLWGVAGDIGW